MTGAETSAAAADAARLVEAATLMRERAHAADALGQIAGVVARSTCPELADHIASWHPVVAIAVADWLEAAHGDWQFLEHSLGAISIRTMSGQTNEPDKRALAVADAYLRRTP